jgi:CheY-like chemotaxis protein
VLNARDAISGTGQIVIVTQDVEIGLDFADEDPDAAPGRYIMVAVSDTGCGISDDIMSRVFDPFFTTKDIGMGTGLGLSQVYGFTKASGGHIKIDSIVGVGTAVRLYLPRSTEVLIQAEAGSHPAQDRRTSSAATVLVVEDDHMVLALASDILSEFGYRLLTAHDATEALAILMGAEPIDILFSDVVMPGGMNGVELAIEARRLRPEIRVLLTSGYPATLLASEHGLDKTMPLLGKPYRLQDLGDSVRTILDGTTRHDGSQASSPRQSRRL